MLERLRHDFQLATVVFCGGISIVAVLPFAAWRLLRGEWELALIDLAIVMVIFWPSLVAWRRGHAGGAALVVSFATTVAIIGIAQRIGMGAVMWSYALLMLNFFIVNRGWPLPANAALIAGMLLQPGVFGSEFEAVTYAVTALLVTLFAFIVSTRAQLQREQLQALALRDTLTGAGNRRLMDVDLRAAQERMRAGYGSYGIALLDIDRFKQVNDRFGHDAGDLVLRQLAEIVRDSTRKFDQFYRFGGEEFVLLLPVADAAALRQVLEKVQWQLRQRLHGPAGAVTVSIGAAMGRAEDPCSEWLARADAALYRAKHAGRDALVLDETEPHAARSIERRAAG